MELRGYQQGAVNDIRRSYRSGIKSVFLKLPTGGGKTVIFTYLMRLLNRKGYSSMMLVRGRKLVKQASNRLHRENTPHQIIMSGEDTGGHDSNIIVASIDTLLSRNFLPDTTLLIIDEADLAVRGKFSEVISYYLNNGAYLLEVSATVSTRGQHSSHLVNPISFKDLVDQGYLCPIKALRPDLSYLNTTNVEFSYSTGEYNSDSLYELTKSSGISGTVVDRYKQYIPNQKTIVSAVTVKHSKEIAQQFNDAGIPALHVDAKTSDKARRGEDFSDRDRAIKLLEDGEVKVLCNVGVLMRGVDIPCLEAIIMARKFASYNLHNQLIGRVTRIFPGKTVGTILDLVGNTVDHDLPEIERPVDLESGKDTRERHVSKVRTCKSCFAVFKKELKVCPVCKADCSETVDNTPEEREGDIDLSVFKPGDSIPLRLKKLEKRAILKGYKKSWSYFQLVEKYGLKLARPYLPTWFIRFYLKKQEIEKEPL